MRKRGSSSPPVPAAALIAALLAALLAFAAGEAALSCESVQYERVRTLRDEVCGGGRYRCTAAQVAYLELDGERGNLVPLVTSEALGRKPVSAESACEFMTDELELYDRPAGKWRIVILAPAAGAASACAPAANETRCRYDAWVVSETGPRVLEASYPFAPLFASEGGAAVFPDASHMPQRAAPSSENSYLGDVEVVEASGVEQQQSLTADVASKWTRKSVDEVGLASIWPVGDCTLDRSKAHRLSVRSAVEDPEGSRRTRYMFTETDVSLEELAAAVEGVYANRSISPDIRGKLAVEGKRMKAADTHPENTCLYMILATFSSGSGCTGAWLGVKIEADGRPVSWCRRRNQFVQRTGSTYFFVPASDLQVSQPGPDVVGAAWADFKKTVADARKKATCYRQILRGYLDASVSPASAGHAAPACGDIPYAITILHSELKDAQHFDPSSSRLLFGSDRGALVAGRNHAAPVPTDPRYAYAGFDSIEIGPPILGRPANPYSSGKSPNNMIRDPTSKAFFILQPSYLYSVGLRVLTIPNHHQAHFVSIETLAWFYVRRLLALAGGNVVRSTGLIDWKNPTATYKVCVGYDIAVVDGAAVPDAEKAAFASAAPSAANEFYDISYSRGEGDDGPGKGRCWNPEFLARTLPSPGRPGLCVYRKAEYGDGYYCHDDVLRGENLEPRYVHEVAQTAGPFSAVYGGEKRYKSLFFHVSPDNCARVCASLDECVAVFTDERPGHDTVMHDYYSRRRCVLIAAPRRATRLSEAIELRGFTPSDEDLGRLYETASAGYPSMRKALVRTLCSTENYPYYTVQLNMISPRGTAGTNEVLRNMNSVGAFCWAVPGPVHLKVVGGVIQGILNLANVFERPRPNCYGYHAPPVPFKVDRDALGEWFCGDSDITGPVAHYDVPAFTMAPSGTTLVHSNTATGRPRIRVPGLTRHRIALGLSVNEPNNAGLWRVPEALIFWKRYRVEGIVGDERGSTEVDRILKRTVEGGRRGGSFAGKGIPFTIQPSDNALVYAYVPGGAGLDYTYSPTKTDRSGMFVVYALSNDAQCFHKYGNGLGRTCGDGCITNTPGVWNATTTLPMDILLGELPPDASAADYATFAAAQAASGGETRTTSSAEVPIGEHSKLSGYAAFDSTTGCAYTMRDCQFPDGALSKRAYRSAEACEALCAARGLCEIAVYYDAVTIDASGRKAAVCYGIRHRAPIATNPVSRTVAPAPSAVFPLEPDASPGPEIRVLAGPWTTYRTSDWVEAKGVGAFSPYYAVISVCARYGCPSRLRRPERNVPAYAEGAFAPQVDFVYDPRAIHGVRADFDGPGAVVLYNSIGALPDAFLAVDPTRHPGECALRCQSLRPWCVAYASPGARLYKLPITELDTLAGSSGPGGLSFVQEIINGGARGLARYRDVEVPSGYNHTLEITCMLILAQPGREREVLGESWLQNHVACPGGTCSAGVGFRLSAYKDHVPSRWKIQQNKELTNQGYVASRNVYFKCPWFLNPADVGSLPNCVGPYQRSTSGDVVEEPTALVKSMPNVYSAVPKDRTVARVWCTGFARYDLANTSAWGSGDICDAGLSVRPSGAYTAFYSADASSSWDRCRSVCGRSAYCLGVGWYPIPGTSNGECFLVVNPSPKLYSKRWIVGSTAADRATQLSSLLPADAIEGLAREKTLVGLEFSSWIGHENHRAKVAGMTFLSRTLESNTECGLHTADGTRIWSCDLSSGRQHCGFDAKNPLAGYCVDAERGAARYASSGLCLVDPHSTTDYANLSATKINMRYWTVGGSAARCDNLFRLGVDASGGGMMSFLGPSAHPSRKGVGALAPDAAQPKNYVECALSCIRRSACKGFFWSGQLGEQVEDPRCYQSDRLEVASATPYYDRSCLDAIPDQAPQNMMTIKSTLSTFFKTSTDIAKYDQVAGQIVRDYPFFRYCNATSGKFVLHWNCPAQWECDYETNDCRTMSGKPAFRVYEEWKDKAWEPTYDAKTGQFLLPVAPSPTPTPGPSAGGGGGGSGGGKTNYAALNVPKTSGIAGCGGLSMRRQCTMPDGRAIDTSEVRAVRVQDGGNEFGERYECVRIMIPMNAAHPLLPLPYAEAFPELYANLTGWDRLVVEHPAGYGAEACKIICVRTPGDGCLALTVVYNAVTEIAERCLFARNSTENYYRTRRTVLRSRETNDTLWTITKKVRSFWNFDEPTQVLALPEYARRTRQLDPFDLEAWIKRFGPGTVGTRAFWYCPGPDAATAEQLGVPADNARLLQPGLGRPDDPPTPVVIVPSLEEKIQSTGMPAKFFSCNSLERAEPIPERFVRCPTNLEYAQIAEPGKEVALVPPTCIGYRGTRAYETEAQLESQDRAVTAAPKTNQAASFIDCKKSCTTNAKCYGFKYVDSSKSCITYSIPIMRKLSNVGDGYIALSADAGDAKFWKVGIPPHQNRYRYPPLDITNYDDWRKGRSPKEVDLVFPCTAKTVGIDESIMENATAWGGDLIKDIGRACCRRMCDDRVACDAFSSMVNRWAYTDPFVAVTSGDLATDIYTCLMYEDVYMTYTVDDIELFSSAREAMYTLSVDIGKRQLTTLLHPNAAPLATVTLLEGTPATRARGMAVEAPVRCELPVGSSVSSNPTIPRSWKCPATHHCSRTFTFACVAGPPNPLPSNLFAMWPSDPAPDGFGYWYSCMMSTMNGLAFNGSNAYPVVVKYRRGSSTQPGEIWCVSSGDDIVYPGKNNVTNILSESDDYVYHPVLKSIVHAAADDNIPRRIRDVPANPYQAGKMVCSATIPARAAPTAATLVRYWYCDSSYLCNYDRYESGCNDAPDPDKYDLVVPGAVSNARSIINAALDAYVNPTVGPNGTAALIGGASGPACVDRNDLLAWNVSRSMHCYRKTLSSSTAFRSSLYGEAASNLASNPPFAEGLVALPQGKLPSDTTALRGWIVVPEVSNQWSCIGYAVDYGYQYAVFGRGWCGLGGEDQLEGIRTSVRGVDHEDLRDAAPDPATPCTVYATDAAGRPVHCAWYDATRRAYHLLVARVCGRSGSPCNGRCVGAIPGSASERAGNATYCCPLNAPFRQDDPLRCVEKCELTYKQVLAARSVAGVEVPVRECISGENACGAGSGQSYCVDGCFPRERACCGSMGETDTGTACAYSAPVPRDGAPGSFAEAWACTEPGGRPGVSRTRGLTGRENRRSRRECTTIPSLGWMDPAGYPILAQGVARLALAATEKECAFGASVQGYHAASFVPPGAAAAHVVAASRLPGGSGSSTSNRTASASSSAIEAELRALLLTNGTAPASAASASTPEASVYAPNATLGLCLRMYGLLAGATVSQDAVDLLDPRPAVLDPAVVASPAREGALVRYDLPRVVRAQSLDPPRTLLPVFATCPAGRRACRVAGTTTFRCTDRDITTLGCCPEEAWDRSAGRCVQPEQCPPGTSPVRTTVRAYNPTRDVPNHFVCAAPNEVACVTLGRLWVPGPITYYDGVTTGAAGGCEDSQRCLYPHEAHDTLATVRSPRTTASRRGDRPEVCWRTDLLPALGYGSIPDPTESNATLVVTAARAACYRLANGTQPPAVAWDAATASCRMASPYRCRLFGDDPAVAELWDYHAGRCVPAASCAAPARRTSAPLNGTLVPACVEPNRLRCENDGNRTWDEARRCCALRITGSVSCCDDAVDAPPYRINEHYFRGGCSRNCSPPAWNPIRRPYPLPDGGGRPVLPSCWHAEEELCARANRTWVAPMSCCLSDRGACLRDPEEFVPHARWPYATAYDPIVDTGTLCPPGTVRAADESSDLGYACSRLWWRGRCDDAAGFSWLDRAGCCWSAAAGRCQNEVGSPRLANATGTCPPEAPRDCGSGSCVPEGACCSWETPAEDAAGGCLLPGMSRATRADRAARRVPADLVVSESTRECRDASGLSALPWRCPLSWNCSEAFYGGCENGVETRLAGEAYGVVFTCDMDHRPDFSVSSQDGIQYGCRAAAGAAPPALCRGPVVPGVGCRVCPRGTNVVPLEDGAYGCTTLTPVGGIAIPWSAPDRRGFVSLDWESTDARATAARCVIRRDVADSLSCFRAAYAAGRHYAFFQKRPSIGAPALCAHCASDPSTIRFAEALAYDLPPAGDLPETTACLPNVVPPYGLTYYDFQLKGVRTWNAEGACRFVATVANPDRRKQLDAAYVTKSHALVARTCPYGTRNCNGSCADANAVGCCRGEYLASNETDCVGGCEEGEDWAYVGAPEAGARRCRNPVERSCPLAYSRAARCCRVRYGCCANEVLFEDACLPACPAGYATMPGDTRCVLAREVACRLANRTWSDEALDCYDARGCLPRTQAWSPSRGACVRAGVLAPLGMRLVAQGDGRLLLTDGEYECRAQNRTYRQEEPRGCLRAGDGCLDDEVWVPLAAHPRGGYCDLRCPNGTLAFESPGRRDCLNADLVRCVGVPGRAWYGGGCRNTTTGCLVGSERACGGGVCVAASSCCPGQRPRPCGDGSCVAANRCCPDAYEPFPCPLDGACAPRGTVCPGLRRCLGAAPVFVANASGCCPEERRQASTGLCAVAGACFPDERPCGSGVCAKPGTCCPGEVGPPPCAPLPKNETACPGGGTVAAGACCPPLLRTRSGRCEPPDPRGCPADRPMDACGRCGGGRTADQCVGCDGVSRPEPYELDACGLCRPPRVSGPCDGPCARLDRCGGCESDRTRPVCIVVPGSLAVVVRLVAPRNATREALDAVAAVVGPESAALFEVRGIRAEIVPPALVGRRRRRELHGQPPDGWAFSDDALVHLIAPPSSDGTDSLGLLPLFRTDAARALGFVTAEAIATIPARSPTIWVQNRTGNSYILIGFGAGAASGLLLVAVAWVVRRASLAAVPDGPKKPRERSAEWRAVNAPGSA